MKSVASYHKVNQLEHVVKRPAMYVGSCTRIARRDWILVNEQATMSKTETPYGVFHLFKEVVSNVGDNVNESRLEGVDPGDCTIHIDGARVTIRNGGLCIPIEYVEGEDRTEVDAQEDRTGGEGEESEAEVLIPMMIFSEMLSGSSLGEDRTGGGAHGIGVKAVGALSSEFRVTIKNATQMKMFTCTWRNNYSEVDGPYIDDYLDPESSVEVSYVIDHKRFGYSERKFQYSEEDIAAFRWIAACLSFTAGIPVHFDDGNVTTLNYDLNSYSALYAAEDADRFTIETENISCIVLDTPRAGKQIGFCNHIINSSGGVHVKAPLNLIKEYITASRNKNKKEVVNKIKLSEIKPHVTVIISVTSVHNPEFGGGQMKTSLTSPEPIVECAGKVLSRISNWGLMRQLDMKTFAKFGAVDPSVKRGRHLKIKTGEDATLAGTKRSGDCELHCVEGDSAEGYDSELLNFIPEGRKTIGTFVMRGKLLNVLKATDEQIQKNRELNELVMRLGLKKVGLDYEDPKNRRDLRYGKLVMMADADEDGNHIRALLLAFFHRFYPSLLRVGFVVDYMTPYLRATQGRNVKRFFFEKQYEDWKKTVDISKWNVRYFKGLGASETSDIKQDYENKKEVRMEYDVDAPAKIELVMGKGEDAADLRKKWMLERDPDSTIVIGRKLPISEFMDFFVRNYSHSTLARNMKTLADGLPYVGRGIIFGTFSIFGRQCKSTKHPKVSDFAGAVGNLIKYHHGDSIQKSVITIAQDFVGSNNLPLLIGKGRFGSMQKGGKHAAQPRYLEVRPSPLLPLIFRPEDDALLTYREVEGKSVEPVFFLPIIPLSLVNGVDCVCTGWRAEIPNYNPLQVIDSYLSRLNKKRFRELTPWYRGYEGTLTLRGNELLCRGVAKFTSDDSYILTCLPIGIWNNKYRKRLMEKVISKEIEDYESQCTSTKTWFSVSGFVKNEESNSATINSEKGDSANNRVAVRSSGSKLTLRDIGAETTKKLSNITLLGPDGMPIDWHSISALMEDFYQFRLPYYTARKQSMINELELKGRTLKERKLYIEACCSRQLVFEKDGRSKKRGDILSDIERLGLCREFYVPSGTKTKRDEADESTIKIKNNGLRVVSPHEMDEDGIAILEEKIRANEEKIEKAKSFIPEQMWRDDLLELRAAYIKMYRE